MRGVSNAAFLAVEDGFEPVLAEAGERAAALGEELFAVVDTLDRSGALRRALSDPARSVDDKAALAHNLLDGKADERVAAVVADLARQRWSTPEDLVEALERLAAETVLAAAHAGGHLNRVETELFRFGRLLGQERAVREVLTDRMATPQARVGVARRLLEGKVHPITQQLVERAARAPRRRTMIASLTDLVRLSAHRRQRLLATVTMAVAPSQAQLARLTALLTRAYGRPVQLNVSLDPEVVGGIRIAVGDEVVDATLLARLEEVRRRLAG